MTSKRRSEDTTLVAEPAVPVAVLIETPVSDEQAARQLRAEARLLREQAGQVMRDAKAAHVAAERGVQEAMRDSQSLHKQAGGLDGEAQRLERRVVLADQADRMALEVAEAERELTKTLDEHTRLTEELGDLDVRLDDLRARAESAAGGVVFAQASGDSASVADYRVRIRAVEEVRAEAARRRETVVERLAAVGRGGQARTYVERHVAELRARRDKVLNELDPTLLARRGDVQRHVERLADAGVDAQIEAVTALLSRSAT